MNKVRFGLIGFGLFGKHHARAIADHPQAELVAVSAKSAESRQQAADTYSTCDALADYHELLQRQDIDVVDIVVPNHLHFEVARAALNANKHILLEKPMTNTVDECAELNRLAKERGRFIAINHELRFSSLWGGAKQLIDEGAIGEPLYALIELSRFPYRPGSEGWRWDIERVGNWILEEPIHFFDLARWYLEACGVPVSVYARANSRHQDRPELQDNFSAVVNFANGGYAVVSQTLSAFEHHVTAKVAGTSGTLWAYWSAADARSDETRYELRYGLGDSITEVPLDRPTGELLELADQIDCVTRCVLDAKSPICTGQDGQWSTHLCLAAQQSVDDKQLVSITTQP